MKLLLQDAIIMGDSTKSPTNRAFLTDSLNCGCAIGGAVIAAGIQEAFLRETRAMPRTSDDIDHVEQVPCIQSLWPWLTYEHVVEISRLYGQVVKGELTIEAVADYVRSVEPQDEPEPQDLPADYSDLEDDVNRPRVEESEYQGEIVRSLKQ